MSEGPAGTLKTLSGQPCAFFQLICFQFWNYLQEKSCKNSLLPFSPFTTKADSVQRNLRIENGNNTSASLKSQMVCGMWGNVAIRKIYFSMAIKINVKNGPKLSNTDLKHTLTNRSLSFWSEDMAFFKLCTSAGLEAAEGAADLCFPSSDFRNFSSSFHR